MESNSVPLSLVLNELKQNLTWQDPIWEKLLFINKSWFGKVSMVDDPKFFFSSRSSSLEEELIAFATAAYNESKAPIADDINKSIPCLWPARYAFLQEASPSSRAVFKNVNCIAFNTFVQKSDPVGMTLVYSSFYPNSPSSLFGHTLIRMDSRRSQESTNTASLLDVSFTFSAFPNSTNPLVYSLKGLAGGFPGFFEIVPFYLKVQEYNHFESRDLWEYKINSQTKGLQRVLGFMWEMRDKFIDYYYFDDNCALVILHLIEVANPEQNLKSVFPTWAIPSETVGVVHSQANLVKSVSYRPSIFRSYLSGLSKLDSSEKGQLQKLVSFFEKHKSDKSTDIANSFKELLNAEFRPTAIAESEKQRAAKILDVFVDLLDFSSKRAGSGESEATDTTSQIRRISLLKRANLGNNFTNGSASENTQNETPQEQAPHLAHRPSRLGLGVFGGNQSSGTELSFKPALHSLSSRPYGFSRELEIGFLNTRWRLQTRRHWQDNQKALKGTLQELTLIEILAMNPMVPFVKRHAWYLRVGYTKEFEVIDRKLNYKSFKSKSTKNTLPHTGSYAGASGIGFGSAGFDGLTQSAGFAGLEAGFVPGSGAFVSPQLRFVQLVSLPFAATLRAEAIASHRWDLTERGFAWSGKAEVSLAPLTQFELLAGFRKTALTNDLTVSLFHYF